MNHACDTPAFRIASDTELLTLDAVHSVVRLKRVARATLTALRRATLARALATRLPVASLTDGAAAVRRAAARCGVILARINIKRMHTIRKKQQEVMKEKSSRHTNLGPVDVKCDECAVRIHRSCGRRQCKKTR